MKDNNEMELRQRLKSSLPAVDLELRRDLWSEVERRFDAPEKRVPWFDWILLGAATAGLIALPQIIPIFLYHL